MQRIGRAVSDDLLTWEREGLLLEADPRWYDREHWRDPWVEWDPSASASTCGLRDAAAAAASSAHATSRDGRWTVGPPLSAPTGHVQLEVPQLVQRDGALADPVLPTSSPAPGVHYLSAPHRLGPYPGESATCSPTRGRATTTPARCSSTAASGVLLAWRMEDEQGAFVGELGDPMPLPRLARPGRARPSRARAPSARPRVHAWTRLAARDGSSSPSRVTA